MPDIKTLDAVTIGQIAAGEVIERPASVVKELVENAIDAGAARITVNVEGGGAGLIEVIDDGRGIPAEQLPLAARRHATSKIANANDLDSIATLGFRGEGLASIAAVSQLTITSRTPDAHVAARVLAHAERCSEPEPVAAPVGTRVGARELFAELPVRREYLRSPSTEFARISGFLSAFALAYPKTAFTLRHDGADVWIMPPTEDPRERLAAVFGKGPASVLIPLTAADSSIGGQLSGFVSAPGHDRADRRMQMLFVNGRLLRSTLMLGAWSGGYATFAMSGRQPYGALFLTLPPENVDANVHPTKSDVRLRYGAQVADGVRRTIAATLRAHAGSRLKESVAATAPVFSAMPSASQAIASELFDGGATENEKPHLRVIGQIARTYIAATDGDSLLLVDQHAAHERVAFEAIRERASRGDLGEPLLVPQILEVDEAQAEHLDRSLETLREGGLEIEPFGERVYRIVATPRGYGSRAFDVRAILDDATDEASGLDARERLFASLACHSVTVAGERLELEEMGTLLERLRQCANPMHCPHGRPTMIRFDGMAIARLFRR
jgi:DNA mismatch repair protein MutL